MLKYALRYAPLPILMLLLIPFRLLIDQGQPGPAPTDKILSAPLPGSALYSVAMLSSQDAWAVGGTFILQKTDQQNKNLRAGSTSYVAPSGGLILHYMANGGWQPDNVSSNLTSPLFSVSLDSPQDGWAVGYGGTFVHYNGNTWSTVPGPANFNKSVMGVAMLSPSDGWAVGYGGSILHYDGIQWMLVQSPTSFDLHSIAMPTAQEGWAVGANGTILHYSGGVWRLIASPTSSGLNDVSMLSANEGWAVGDDGTILHYRDGVWESVYSTIGTFKQMSLVGVTMSSIRSGWIISNERMLTYSSEVWTPATLANRSAKILLNNLHLHGITMSPSREGWAVGGAGTDKGDTALAILHYQNGEWSPSSITS
jgi:hypothetical protein